MVSDEKASYEDDRQWLVKAGHHASRDFDRTLTTLASGALALSVAFVHDIAPTPTDLPWLAAAWALFAVSLLVILMSFLTSEAALRYEIKALDTDMSSERRVGGCAGTATQVLNLTAAVTLVIGVAALLIFAFLNLEQSKPQKGNNDGTEKTTEVIGGWPPKWR